MSMPSATFGSPPSPNSMTEPFSERRLLPHRSNLHTYVSRPDGLHVTYDSAPTPITLPIIPRTEDHSRDSSPHTYTSWREGASSFLLTSKLSLPSPTLHSTYSAADKIRYPPSTANGHRNALPGIDQLSREPITSVSPILQPIRDIHSANDVKPLTSAIPHMHHHSYPSTNGSIPSASKSKSTASVPVAKHPSIGSYPHSSSPPDSSPTCVSPPPSNVTMKVRSVEDFPHKSGKRSAPSRTRHNIAEQKRRLQIRESFDRLKTLIPTAERKMSKVVLLNEAFEYISQLKEKAYELESVNHSLKDELGDKDRQLEIEREKCRMLEQSNVPWKKRSLENGTKDVSIVEERDGEEREPSRKKAKLSGDMGDARVPFS